MILARYEDTDSRVRQEEVNLDRIVENDVGEVEDKEEEEDKEDDEGDGDERDIWEVTHVTEEDFERTEGEAENLYDKLMEMTGRKVTDKELDHDLT